MSHPNNITIGPQVYRVTSAEIDYLRRAAGSADIYGEIVYGESIIYLSPKQDAQHTRLSLLHEVIHGCIHLTAPELENEEAAVRAITGPLLDVLRRNPEFVAYLTEPLP